MTSCRNKVILLEHTEVWALEGKEQEDHSPLVRQLDKHVPCAMVPVCCTKSKAWRCFPEAGVRRVRARCWSGTMVLVRAESLGWKRWGLCWTVQWSQTRAIVKITGGLEKHIAGTHSQSFWFRRCAMRPQNVHFKSQVTLMLLVLGPHFENNLDSIRITVSQL